MDDLVDAHSLQEGSGQAPGVASLAFGAAVDYQNVHHPPLGLLALSSGLLTVVADIENMACYAYAEPPVFE